MKIKSISCTQFAGVRDRVLDLTDGINAVYGKNESGKSTIVNLISRTLFQNPKLDRRKDKDFYENFFPSAKRNSSFTADWADGKITLETENGVYTLEKEWGADPRCKLSAPDGTVRDNTAVNELLRGVLIYGEGVYSDVLFSSQRNADISLMSILDPSKATDAKREITNAVSRAFAESGGIPIDSIEREINAKINEIAGNHWDAERGRPMRKAGRWANGLGEILKSYYAMEDANAVLEEISALENAADRAAADYAEKDADLSSADDAYNKFSAFASRLALRNERVKAASRLDAELKKITAALEKWPETAKKVKKAKELEKELADRKTLDIYETAKSLSDTIAKLKASSVICPDGNEILAVRASQRNFDILSNRLRGMNLNAAIKMLGDNTIEITSIRTGEKFDISDSVSITEAVDITVPGVMEMRLSPAGTDTAEICARLDAERAAIEAVYAKYGVKSIDELERLREIYTANRANITAASGKLDMLLGADSFDSVKKRAAGIKTEPRPADVIERDITALCGGLEIGRFIAANETTLTSYAEEYGSIDGLKTAVSDTRAELSKVRGADPGDDIPAEFAAVADPEAHLAKLRDTLELKRRQREDALAQKAAASSRLEGYKDSVSCDPAAAADAAKRAFEEQKSLLAHWLRIAEVFAAEKEKLSENPLNTLTANFTRCLGIISGGRVASEFPEDDKLNMQIYSDDRLLDYPKLSEGTKETVSLAFRLAVLDHLFPDGGGIAVLDDPFANMDADRAARSVELIKDFAARHQIIFLTCREEYLGALGGNIIRLT